MVYNFSKRLFFGGTPMIFSINRINLVEILSEFTNILKDNPIRPVLSGLKIEAIDDKIIFTGTNMETNFIREVRGEVNENGVVVFKPQLVFEYVKLLDNETIIFSLQNETLLIHQAEFTILDADIYPMIPKLTFDKIIDIKGRDLVKSFEKVKFSSAISNENLAINCIRTIFSSEGIEFISTDSYRLTYLKEDYPCSLEKELSIPIETIIILCKLMKDLDDIVTIGHNGSTLVFLWKDIYFSTKLIDMPFPNVKAIIAGANFTKMMEFSTKELKSALKKVMTVARTSIETKNGALFEFKNNNLIMSAFSGKAKITQKVNMIKTGEDLRCSLNTKYLYDFIENIEKNTVIKGNAASAMFEVSEFENPSYKYILMPLALRD